MEFSIVAFSHPRDWRSLGTKSSQSEFGSAVEALHVCVACLRAILPTSAWISPAFTSKLTPSSAAVAPNRLRRFWAPAATSFMRNRFRGSCASVLRSGKTGQ